MKWSICCLAMLMVSAAFSKELLYRNDFSVRQSAAAVPQGAWREVPYFPGAFVNDNYSNPFSGTVYQDGWIRGKNACNCPALIVDDNGNQEAVICNASDVNLHAVLKHRLGTTLTAGLVTAQCDFRAPTDWYGYTRSIRFALGDEAFFSPETDSEGGAEYLKRLALYAGVTHDDSGKYHFYRLNQALAAGAAKGHWYRLVVSLDLDARTWSCAYYDMGTDHPAIDAETPETPAFAEENLPMPYAAVTSVSALGIACYCPHGGLDASTLSQTAQFDNIRVAHNGVECYRNDFSARCSRTLDGTLTDEYRLDALVTNTVGTEVYSGNRVLVANQNAGITGAQPIGVDGWRRLNKDGPVSAKVYPGSSYYLMFDTDNLFGAAAHPLGSTVSSGIFRLETEAYVPDNWHNTAILYIKLGDEAHYNGANSVFNTKRYAQAAFREGKFAYWNGQERVDIPMTITKKTWYRFVLTVDLDAKTYGVALYDLSADGALVYEKTNIAKVDDVSEISCYSLWAYYARVLYDNVRAYHKASASAPEILLYENTFSSRTYYHQNLREGALVGRLASSPVGQDGWKRVDTGAAKIVVRKDGDNQAVSFDNGKNASGYAVNDLGKNVKTGHLVTQIDVKPPRTWQGDQRGSYFWLGGDRFAEGNCNTTLNEGNEQFSKWGALLVGFSDRTGTANGVGLYTNVSACVSIGDGAGGYELKFAEDLAIDATRWYRFVIKANLDSGVSDVELYDMGTTHPTFATAMPQAPVAVFGSLPFVRDARLLSGISSIGFSTMGVVANTMDTRDVMFWDNISVTSKSNGFVIIVQ